MANIKSAQKRISTINRRNAENKYVKATISTYTKKFRKLIEEGKLEEAEKFSREVYAYIDSACSKGVIHKNNASRKIGRLAESLYKAKVASTETKAVAEKKEAEVEEPKTSAPVVEEKKETPKATATKAKKAPAEKKADKPAKEEKPVKATKAPKTEKTEKPAKSEKPAKAEKTEKAEKAPAKKTTKKADK